MPQNINSDNKRGIILMLAAMAGFAIEDLFMKTMGEFWSPMQILMMVGFIGGTIYALIARRQGVNVFDRKLISKGPLLRLTGEVFGSLAFATSLILGSISLSSTIAQVMPLLVTLGAVLFLGEQVGWRRWAAIFVGFFGVLLVIEPWGTNFNPYSLLALIGAIGLSGRDLVTRTINSDIPSIALATWGFWILVPSSLVLMLFGHEFAPMQQEIAIPLVLAIIAGISGYYCLILSMRVGEISAISPFRYSRMVFGMLIGVILFNEQISMSAFIGAVIILVAGIYSFMRERKLANDFEK